MHAPAAARPADSGSASSESSTEEQGESETSLATSLTMSPPPQRPRAGTAPGLLQGVDGQLGWSQEKQQDGEEEEEEEEAVVDDDDDEEEEEEEAVVEQQRARKRCSRRAHSLSLMGTSADSGLSMTAAEMEGRLWDGAAGSPQYSNALHHLWLTTYNRSAPYVSTDDSDSDDSDMLEELQELREK